MPKLKINENHTLSYRLIHGGRDKPYLVFLHEGLDARYVEKFSRTIM